MFSLYTVYILQSLNKALIMVGVCVYVFFVAKPVDNLALAVFRLHYAELCRGLSSCPDQVAMELYGACLITAHDKSQAVGTLENTPLRKADILMEAVEGKIDTENSATSLRKFCHLFKRGYGVDSIIARMKSRLGE